MAGVFLITFLAATILAVWAGWRWARLFYQHAHWENSPPSIGDDVSVLEWLRYVPTLLIYRFFSGTKIKTPGSDLSESEVNANELDSPEITLDSGADAATVTILDEPGPSLDSSSNVHLVVQIPRGTKIRVTVEALPDGEVKVVAGGSTENLELNTAIRKKQSSLTWKTWNENIQTDWSHFKALSLSNVARLNLILFFLGCFVYLFTRLWGLERFPIYFFADEAAQTLYAQTLIANHFRDANGLSIPIYVEAAGLRWTPLISMYIQAISLLIFGKSIFITRATSAIVSILAAVSVSLILKQFFNSKYWWSGALFLAISPTWFIHSRTAFETVMTTAFYGCFIYAYLLYRLKSPKFIYLALLFGAITFYTYSNAQAIMAFLGIALFLSDLPYHLRNWKHLLSGFLVVLVLAIPFIIFRAHEPQAIGEHLRAVSSYWEMPIPLTSKLSHFFSSYFYGLSPQYWFFANEHDLARHRWAGSGHLLWIVLPFVVIGTVICIKRIRSSAHRTIILSALATPVGAALLDISITRVLTFVIPAAILTVLGVDWLMDRINRKIAYPVSAVTVFGVLSLGSLFMLQTALIKGPTWFRDYGLYGMQWGASQLFNTTIPKYLEADNANQVFVTSTWANGTDNFLRYFIPEEQWPRVQMGSVESYLFEKLPLNDNMIFILTPSEYQKAVESPKFKIVENLEVIPYPDGSPGFYIARLAYADNVDQIFQAEKEARQKPLEATVDIGGEQVLMRYSQTDAGQPSDIFDGDFYTLMRGLEANPFIFEFIFSKPRKVTGITADFGNMDYTITTSLTPDGTGEEKVYQTTQRNVTGDPHVEMEFADPPDLVKKLRIEINSLNAGETAHIHIRNLNILP